MSIASATASKTTADSAAPAPIVELPVGELDALIARVEEAKQAQLCLSAEDCDLLLNAVLTLATMQERLSHNDLTITKLKKLLGIVRSSEKTNDLFPGIGRTISPSHQARARRTQKTSVTAVIQDRVKKATASLKSHTSPSLSLRTSMHWRH